MAYTRPTLSSLITGVKNNLFARFPSLDPSMPNSFAANLAEVIAGAVSGLYGYLDWTADQSFPDTADDENATRWATIFGLTRLAAIKADGDCTFTGTIGSAVATGALVVSSSGVEYSVDAGFTLAGGSEDHAVTAVVAGSDGNFEAATELSFVSTPAEMDTTVTVASGGLTGGTDQETDEELRQRILIRLANPPKGGSDADYEAWAVEATDVTRSWPRNTTSGATYGDVIPAGEVWQYFVMDDTYTTPATLGIPAAGDVTDVQDYIDARRPVAAIYTAIAPVADTVDFNLTILPDTPTNQAATDAELLSTIKEERLPGGTIPLSSFNEAMGRVPNLTGWTINTINGGAPAGVAVAAGDIHTLGTTTYV
jgi:uncharacterized phage protein gp47/JayE